MQYRSAPIIDAVITWVDGYDPQHQQKRRQCLEKLGQAASEGAAPTRFNQQGEISFCIHSILTYAPWINTIYILTDQQTPAVLETFKNTAFASKLVMVDHRHIFRDYEQYLPTFNSVSIESLLWRIEGLSEHFIYFNDDCSLIKPVVPEDFFQNGHPVTHGWWKVQHAQKFRHQCSKLLGLSPSQPDQHRILQENAARLAGLDKYFYHLPHAPFPLRRSTLENFFTKNQDHLHQNIAYPFRDNQQFWPISLAYHLELNNKTAITHQNFEEVTLHAAQHSFKKMKKKLSFAEQAEPVKFVCMQSLDQASLDIQTYLISWLQSRLVLSQAKPNNQPTALLTDNVD